jgi:hypothetical protein
MFIAASEWKFDSLSNHIDDVASRVPIVACSLGSSVRSRFQAILYVSGPIYIFFRIDLLVWVDPLIMNRQLGSVQEYVLFPFGGSSACPLLLFGSGSSCFLKILWSILSRDHPWADRSSCYLKILWLISLDRDMPAILFRKLFFAFPKSHSNLDPNFRGLPF